MLCRKYLARQSGFTLIELMVVVAIVAILLAVALPTWNEQVKRSKRTAAQAVMLDIANRQQQYLLSNRTYMDDAELVATGFALDPDIAQNYTYDIEPGTGAVPSYVLTFTAKGRQTSDGDMTLDEQGVGTPTEYWSR